LAARLARLERQVNEDQHARIAQAAGGKDLAALSADLLNSIDADATSQQAIEQFKIPEGQEPTEQQITQVEQERMRAALKPFLNPKLRGVILDTLMQIWRMHPDGSDQEQITKEQDHNHWFPHISPNGTMMLYLAFDKSVASSDHPENKDVAIHLVDLRSGKHRHVQTVRWARHNQCPILVCQQ